jgi:hypothetical protein
MTMKWLVMLGLMLVGCGSDAGEDLEGCAALSVDDCDSDASCTVLDLRAWTGTCWSSASGAACIPARATCAPVSGCFVDRDGKRWLGDGDCLPQGWHETSGDECGGEPLCN